ncbi:MAG: hypothetical protein ABEJ28_10780 [Salinigranum sp.]
MLGFATVDRRVAAVVGLFGVVCPMIFGMAYLLLPPYVGRTLAVRRPPGVHFAATCLGGVLLTAAELRRPSPEVFLLGALVWSLGVTIFLGSLLWTALPAVVRRPEVPLRSGDRPQRSTRAATAAIPVALGYLAVGTIGLLSVAGVPRTGTPASVPRVLHAYGAGFGALLVFALGARLLIGFFHVRPPRYAAVAVLVCGAIAPALLAAHLWIGPWFRTGGTLEAASMVGYAALVGSVAARSTWRRVGLYGITLGALAGVVAVGFALPVAFGGGRPGLLDAHATLVLQGFFGPTIVGYAYQFFPVTAGRFRGASERTARATIGLLALGTFVRVAGSVSGVSVLYYVGVGVATAGAVGYAYLLVRRLLTG